jgi:predicted transcriptional regulator
MESLSNLFFELSHTDRLNLITLLKKSSSLKLTVLAEELGISTQEVYRHLSRLQDVLIVDKTIEGDYELTSFGEDLLLWLPGISFLQNNKNYFKSHILSGIPDRFRLRIGELEEAEPVDHIMLAINNVEQMIERAEEYMYIISDQIIMSTIPNIMSNLEKGVKLHSIEPTDFKPDPQFLEQYTDEELRTYHESKANKLLQEAKLSKVPVVLYLSEKEVGFIGFPDSQGKLDFIGFSSKSPEAHGWCLELFEALWEKSTVKPVIDTK